MDAISSVESGPAAARFHMSRIGGEVGAQPGGQRGIRSLHSDPRIRCVRNAPDLGYEESLAEASASTNAGRSIGFR